MTVSPQASCGRRFDEELLSGYLDGMLTQQERQVVSLHLDGCTDCRQLFDDLRAMREAARGTAFAFPPDEQWNELPRTAGSSALRLGGFTLLVVWLVMLTAGVGVAFARSRTPTWVTLLVVGAGSAFLLLLFAALLDRLHDMRHDRYRRVQK